MTIARVDLTPPVRVGDKIVQVGPLDWSGFKALAEALAKADLPLPSLQGDGLRKKLAGVRAAGAFSPADVAELAFEFVADNVPTLFAWACQHPPLVTALVRGASNLNDEEIAALSAGEVLRAARAAYAALANDGVFAEAAGFFGDVVGLRPPTTAGRRAADSPPSAAGFASESKSPSPPPPDGA